MGACDDFIFFDLPEDWERIVNQSRTATIITETTHTPILPFDLGVNLAETYLAIFAQTTQGRPTWRFAGELRQVWEFPKGAQTSQTLSKIQSDPIPVFLDKLQIVELVTLTTGNFELKFQPPPWFKDVLVSVWKYNGEVDNFVKDTLFDIGNQLGVGTGGDPSSISALLETQSELITNSTETINTLISDLQASQEANYLDLIDAVNSLETDSNLLTQLNQLDAGIFTLFEAIRNLIPPSEANQLETTLRVRLDLNEEFL